MILSALYLAWEPHIYSYQGPGHTNQYGCWRILAHSRLSAVTQVSPCDDEDFPDTWPTEAHVNPDRVTDYGILVGACFNLAMSGQNQSCGRSVKIYHALYYRCGSIERDAKRPDRCRCVPDASDHISLCGCGWAEESLGGLFELRGNFREDGWVQVRVDVHECPRCAECSCAEAHDPMIVDVQWQLLLEEVKRGSSHNGCEPQVEECALEDEELPLGRLVLDYEWVCLRCWHEAGDMIKRAKVMV